MRLSPLVNSMPALVVALTLMVAASPALANDLRLIEAIKKKDAAAIRQLLAARIDVRVAEADGATALHWAAYRDDLETVDRLLAAGADANAANDLKITPLALAAVNRNAAVVDRLLRAGANANAASESGVTPLMQASRTGSVETVRALINAGADVNAKEHARDQTALMWAVAQSHPEVVRTLLEHKADIRARTRVRPLRVQLDKGRVFDSEGRRTFKTSHEDAAWLETGGSTALVFAALAGNAESMKLLLSAGADPNERTADGSSVLVNATFSGYGSTLGPILLDAGADPNSSAGGYTALHTAVLRSDLEAVQLLLSRGANPNAKLTRGSRVRRFGAQWALSNKLAGATPVFLAASYLEIDILKALLAGGGSPNDGLTDGTTPAMAATGVEHERINRPTEGGADTDDDPAPESPESRVQEAIHVLVQSGASLTGVNQAGDTLLHGAAASGLPEVIQFLVNNGARVDVKNGRGLTPLELTIGGRPTAGLKRAQELLRQLENK